MLNVINLKALFLTKLTIGCSSQVLRIHQDYGLLIPTDFEITMLVLYKQGISSMVFNILFLLMMSRF